MALSNDLMQALDDLFGVHPGFRPAHAKGILLKGDFTPSPDAASLTRAPHAQRKSTPVTVRFSDSPGIPTIPDNDPNASPRGFAVRFHLAEHVHTDIIGHSVDGFAVRTPEEFLEFLRAVKATGPDSPKPTPIEQFLGGHPSALAFVTAPKPIPTSFAKESFFTVNAFKFVNKDGDSQFGRFRIRPDGGGEYLDAAAAAAKSPNFLFDEITARIAKGPIKLHVVVQLAATGDVVDDASIHWPEERVQLEFGTITLTEPVANGPAEERQIIFDPIPRVDGIEPSADPLLEVRAALYLLSGRRRRAAAQGTTAG
ncbi:MAG TPA: catalase family peroxidase [Bryobacteraceae bacterium]|nr:catalase family peroxidase [Bryobacteraceae bacterium]